MKKSNPRQRPLSFPQKAVFCAEPSERPNYFNGRFLGADDFIAEQEYHRNKQRQHNRHCHGVGVVSGLEVSTVNGNSDWVVIVGVGVAIDPEGNEIHLCEPARLSLLDSHTVLQVGIRYAERFSGSVPVTGEAGESRTMPALVQEGCEIVLEPRADALKTQTGSGAGSKSANVLPLARLVRRRNAWRLDKEFKVRRSH